MASPTNPAEPSEPNGLPPQPLDPWFLALLACPGCDQRRPVTLGADGSRLVCTCGRYAYPVRDGIPILLVDEAIVLDESIPAGGRESEAGR